MRFYCEAALVYCYLKCYGKSAVFYGNCLFACCCAVKAFYHRSIDVNINRSAVIVAYGYLSACEVKGIAYLIGCLCKSISNGHCSVTVICNGSCFAVYLCGKGAAEGVVAVGCYNYLCGICLVKSCFCNACIAVCPAYRTKVAACCRSRCKCIKSFLCGRGCNVCDNYFVYLFLSNINSTRCHNVVCEGLSADSAVEKHLVRLIISCVGRACYIK